MKSTIRVDFKGPDTNAEDGFEPVIKVELMESDDVRDKLLKTFFQSLGTSSSWLKVKFNQGVQISRVYNKDNKVWGTVPTSTYINNNSITLTPVKSKDLVEESIEMNNRVHTELTPKKESFKNFLYRKIYLTTDLQLSTTQEMFYEKLENDKEPYSIPLDKVIKWVNEYLEK